MPVTTREKPRLLLTEAGYRPPPPLGPRRAVASVWAALSSPVIMAGGALALSYISIRILPPILRSPPVEVVESATLPPEEPPEPTQSFSRPVQAPPVPAMVSAPLIEFAPPPPPVAQTPPPNILATESAEALELLEHLSEQEEIARLERERVEQERQRVAEEKRQREAEEERKRQAILAEQRREREAREAEARAAREREMARDQAADARRREAERQRLAEEKARQAEAARQAAAAKKIASTPVLTRRSTPNYPTAARKAGVQGTVRISATITADGRVQTPRVIGTSGSAALDSSAMAAVKKWRFTPAKNGLGQSVAYQLTIPVTFRLN